MNVKSFTVLATALVIFAGNAIAEDTDGKKRERRGPPAVAIEACSASVVGDPCSFEGRRGETRNGECAEGRSEQLVCRSGDRGQRLKRRGKRGKDKESAPDTDSE